ncbi:MAG: HyaD/HybD family hydrogenase maturation endopeptidase [Hyphomicrobiales bacterium]|nr:HyaD/HybD family hydrogenase maturation endopeptidase [Hyphomicrobiales bacterium]
MSEMAGPAVKNRSEATTRGLIPVGRSVLVLGLGNILLTDEGIGVRVLQTLRSRYHLPAGVDAIDGGTAGMDLIDLIAGYDDLIVIDAMETGDPPGTVRRLADHELSRFLKQKLSPHQLGFTDVLAFLELMDKAPQTITMIGIQPASLDLGLEISPSLSSEVNSYADLVARELQQIGFVVTPYEDCSV